MYQMTSSEIKRSQRRRNGEFGCRVLSYHGTAAFCCSYSCKLWMSRVRTPSDFCDSAKNVGAFAPSADPDADGDFARKSP